MKFFLLVTISFQIFVSCSKVEYTSLIDQAFSSADESFDDSGESEETDSTPQTLSASVLKLSDSNATFEGSDNTADCSYYLIGIKGTGAWRPSTFVYNNKVYFNVPCKYTDAGSGGWHWGIMSWTPALGMVWYDGDPITPGDNEVVSLSDTDSNGFSLSSTRNFYMVDTGSGLKGLGVKYFRASQYHTSNVPTLFQAKAVVPSNGYYFVSFNTSSPESLAASDFLVDEEKSAHIFNENDDTWKGQTYREAELFYSGGEVYIYSSSTNAPTKDKDFIYVSKSTDMITFEKPVSPILEGYKCPHVFKQNGTLYMIAFNNNVDKWQLLKGSSPLEFDTENAFTLDLGVEIFGASGWDDTPSFTSLPNNQPEIAGVEVLNEKVYIFYMAGQFGQMRTPANGVSGAPYDSPRGIGTFELTIE